MQFMNRFNWIGQQQDDEEIGDIYLLCKNELDNGTRCSHLYRKGAYEDDTCPVCGAYAAVSGLMTAGSNGVRENTSRSIGSKWLSGLVG